MKKINSTAVKYTLTIYVYAFMLLFISSCKEQPFTLQEGTWRATLQRPDGQQIAFNFESKDSAGRPIAYIINGEEHLLVDSIRINKDSLVMQMPFFESGFQARFASKDTLEGVWVKKTRDNKASFALQGRIQ